MLRQGRKAKTGGRNNYLRKKIYKKTTLIFIHNIFHFFKKASSGEITIWSWQFEVPWKDEYLFQLVGLNCLALLFCFKFNWNKLSLKVKSFVLLKRLKSQCSQKCFKQGDPMNLKNVLTGWCCKHWVFSIVVSCTYQ